MQRRPATLQSSTQLTIPTNLGRSASCHSILPEYDVPSQNLNPNKLNGMSSTSDLFKRLSDTDEETQPTKRPRLERNESDSGDNHHYHDLFLQRNGMEYTQPIFFEDGMDYDECEMYYQSISSQRCGGAPSRPSKHLEQRNTTHWDPKANNPGVPPSCIRHSNRSATDNAEASSSLQRCSFSGLPARAAFNEGDEESTRLRSHSLRGIQEYQLCVSFDESVQVATIHSIDEYPEDVRRNMWMSKEEMMLNVEQEAQKMTTNDDSSA